ncbi:EthD family reductase [Amycolatopsis sp.]|uniref:EthD family reductase n=1 Tax=Amycolatopsis sp. TaxID=37632 RepID=UPI002C34BDC3|nr:EthD family reductase [Amycolatopsis sp.]HVV13878.1 EthD family reductase [Amycolatopsis sp.]
MHKLLVLYSPVEDTEAFKEYYVNNHLPLAAKLPGLRAMRYSFDVHAGGRESPYFALFEADFDDADALTAALGSPEGRAVAADVPNYAGDVLILDYPVTD